MLVEETDERELSQIEVIEGRGECDGEKLLKISDLHPPLNSWVRLWREQSLEK